MRKGREGAALVITAVIVVLVLIAAIYFKTSWSTAPVDRTNLQNQGTNAPAEVVPAPGTPNNPNGTGEPATNNQ